MRTLKLIVFLELLAMLLCGVIHLVFILILKDTFPLVVYPTIAVLFPLIVLFAELVKPIAEWFLK
jgi:hypothetical protein